MRTDQHASKKEILSLHVLRVVVIWGIVIYHGSILIQDRLGITYPYFFSKFLYSGVDVLFVLSGFLIYLQNHKNFATESITKAWHFLKKRAIRIVPLYELLTLGLVAIYVLVPHLSNSIPHPVAIIKSLFFWPAYWPVLSVGWILSYQLYFYLLFSLLIIKKTQPIFWIIMSLSLILNLMKINLFVFNYFNLEFLLGLASAYCYINYPKAAKSILISYGISILALSITLDVFYDTILKDSLRVLFYGISSFFFIWGTALIKIKVRVKIMNFIKILSDSSYALFLSHYPMLAFLSVIVFKTRRFFILEWLIISLLAIFLGVLIYKCIEQPLTSLIKKHFQTR